MGKKINQKSEKDFFPLFQIRNKQEKIIPFNLNKAQSHYRANRTTRDIILKARQMGFTTYIKMEDLNECLLYDAVSCFTIADTFDKALTIFNKVRIAIDKFEPKEFIKALEIKTISKSMVEFGLNLSKIKAGTPSKAVGDTISRLHASEYALYTPGQKADFEKAKEAVPEDGYIVIETTARGDDDFALLYRDAKKGLNEWTAHFYAWFWDEQYQMQEPKNKDWKDLYQDHAREYSLTVDPVVQYGITENQFMWYAHKVFDIKKEILQEYPMNDEECFFGSSPTVFDKFILNQLFGVPPISKWENGELLIWREPQDKRRYVVICDVAQGEMESDFSTICVFDLLSGDLEAEYMGRLDPVTHARMAERVAVKYNLATIIPERNHHGHSFINTLNNELNYPNIYKDSKGNLGFMTDKKSKVEYILGPKGLNQALIDNTICIRSERGIAQMKRFVRLDNSRMGGERRRYDNDDLVISYGIFCLVREDLTYKHSPIFMFKNF